MDTPLPITSTIPPDRAGMGRRQWVWPLFFAGLIVAMSHRSTVPGPGWPGLDKAVHFGAFGLLATLVCRLGRGWRAAAWVVVAVSVFGAVDEWHQSHVPGRTAEVADWVADTLGAVVAVALYTGWPAYRRMLEWRLAAGRRQNAAARPG